MSFQEICSGFLIINFLFASYMLYYKHIVDSKLDPNKNKIKV